MMRTSAGRGRRSSAAVVAVAVVVGVVALASPASAARLTAISIKSSHVTEGDTGTVFAVVRVTLSRPKTTTVTVNFETGGKFGETATANRDYVRRQGQTLSFPPGSTYANIVVPVIGDQLVEPDEFFTVHLYQPSGGPTIADDRGKVTIFDDDE